MVAQSIFHGIARVDSSSVRYTALSESSKSSTPLIRILLCYV